MNGLPREWAGLVAEHHDSYAMWDSELTPWNSKDTGPDSRRSTSFCLQDEGMQKIKRER